MRSRPIPESWRSYRQRKRRAVWLLVAGFPLAVVFAIAAKVLLGASSEFVFIGAVVLWCAAWGYAAIRVSRWPCPRCSQPWLANQEARLGAPRVCANCRLGLYEAP